MKLRDALPILVGSAFMLIGGALFDIEWQTMLTEVVIFLAVGLALTYVMTRRRASKDVSDLNQPRG